VDDSRFSHLKSGDYESYSFAIVDTQDTLFNKKLVLATKLNGQNEIYYESYLAKIPKIDILPSAEPGDLISNEIQLSKLETNFSFNKTLAYISTADCLSVYSVKEVTYFACEARDTSADCYVESGGVRSLKTGTRKEYTLMSSSCSSGGGGSSSGSGSSGSESPESGSLGSGSSGGGAGFMNPHGETPFGYTDITNDPESEARIRELVGKQEFVERFMSKLDGVNRRWLEQQNNFNFNSRLTSYLLSHRNTLGVNYEDFAIEAINQKKNYRNVEVDFENKSLEDSSVPKCVGDIIDKLKPTNGNPGFNVGDLDDAIKNQLNIPLNPNNLSNFPGDVIAMFNNDQNYGLKFKVGPVEPTSNGAFRNAITETGPTNLGHRMSTITLNEEYVNRATDLAIARTLIHELMHAYISYSINNNNEGFIGTAIDNLIIQTGATRSGAQHELMARQFVDIMSASLATLDNNQQATVEYERLAWSGDMRQSDVFALLDRNERNAIIARDQIESGDPQNTLPVSPLGIKNC
jgi:hypothetical protein